MKTQQMVQEELKSERVQEEMVAEAPMYRAWLKAERVQEPAAAAAERGKVSSAFELMIHQQEPVKVELLAQEIVITFHGTNAGQAG
jgi:hypothetical protein